MKLTARPLIALDASVEHARKDLEALQYVEPSLRGAIAGGKPNDEYDTELEKLQAKLQEGIDERNFYCEWGEDENGDQKLIKIVKRGKLNG